MNRGTCGLNNSWQCHNWVGIPRPPYVTLVGQQDERKINPKLKSNPDVCNELILDRKVKINIDRFDEDRKDISQSQFTIYTNGSKIKEDTGPGFIIYYNKQPDFFLGGCFWLLDMYWT